MLHEGGSGKRDWRARVPKSRFLCCGCDLDLASETSRPTLPICRRIIEAVAYPFRHHQRQRTCHEKSKFHGYLCIRMLMDDEPNYSADVVIPWHMSEAKALLKQEMANGKKNER
eukprot:scaffold15409_cov53-Attheya_sp.AAC.7